MLYSVFIISSSSLPRSTMMTFLSMSAVSNYPGILTMSISLLPCASIADVISINSNATAGYVVPFFCDTYRCFRTSAYDTPLTVLLHFSLGKIVESRASYFSLFLMLAKFMRAKVISVCSWFSYFSTATSPTFLDSLSPLLSKYYVIT